MYRRTLLATVGTVPALVVAGCAERDSASGPESDGESPGGSDRVADVEFETRGDARDVKAVVEDGPVVEGDEHRNEIRVEGRYAIGDGCHEESLQGPVYDEASDTLTITLSREHDGRDDCELEDQEVPYRLVVTIEGALPGTVEVTEDGNGSEGGETRVELG